MNPQALANELEGAAEAHGRAIRTLNHLVRRLEEAESVPRPEAESVLDDVLVGGARLRELTVPLGNERQVRIAPPCDLMLRPWNSRPEPSFSEIERLCDDVEVRRAVSTLRSLSPVFRRPLDIGRP
jgi:hypothetical protein